MRGLKLPVAVLVTYLNVIFSRKCDVEKFLGPKKPLLKIAKTCGPRFRVKLGNILALQLVLKIKKLSYLTLQANRKNITNLGLFRISLSNTPTASVA